MNPQKIVELANLLRNRGDKILSSEFCLTLSGPLLCGLNDSFTLIADSLDNDSSKNFQVLKTINAKSSVFRDLQLIYDFVQKTPLLCIMHYPSEDCYEGFIDISKFRALERLEIQKVHIHQIIGIQPLRAQLQQIICIKSIHSVDDIITKCGGDNSNGFVWNELKMADFSYNNLKQVDTSLEFAQYLQHLNLRHNQLQSVAAIKWLPHLKVLDLSFNRLLAIPQFHMDAYKRLEMLNMSNNLVEDLMGIVKLEALTDLDISDNCLLDHSCLLPLSVLLCLRTLNLYGNPLHCHPKHRLATAQYLNKKCSIVKFILDYEPLTKKEKNLLGTQKLKQIGALNQYNVRSSSTTTIVLSTPGRLTPTSNHTPSSSLGSIRSFFHLNGSDNNSVKSYVMDAPKTTTLKTKSNKTSRTVEIVDSIDLPTDNTDSTYLNYFNSTGKQKNGQSSKSVLNDQQQKQEHLETKRHIENLRKKYGNEWLQEDKVETLNNILGVEKNTLNNDIGCNKSRQLFQEYLKLIPENSTLTDNSINDDNTAEEEKNLNECSSNLSSVSQNQINTTLYQTSEQIQLNDSDLSDYQSFEINHKKYEDEHKLTNGIKNIINLDNVYKQSNNKNNDNEASEPEEDEEFYMVYHINSKEPIFLTKSLNFLRERNPTTKRTICKWSLKILESCDRIKYNTLRINFDTIKLNKQERIYTIAETECYKLEKELRDILSQRDLIEMNQTVYRCVNCNCQFSQEQRYQRNQPKEIHCPNCKSTFVAEIHEVSKSVSEKFSKTQKISPSTIVEELPDIIIPLRIEKERNDSIGLKNNTNTEKKAELLPNIKTIKNSIQSLNGSSSCTKISDNNSENSSTSRNSVSDMVPTIINANNYKKINSESDIDVISCTSQSSIEVLGNSSSNNESRKTSEERHVSQAPNLETINDISCTPTFDDMQFPHEEKNEKSQKYSTDTNKMLLQREGNLNSTNTLMTSSDSILTKNPDSLSTMFGGLFQSTNILMSSSKTKHSEDNKNTSNNVLNQCQPYKYNYSDFNDIDHRLKLYLYQTQFQEREENFKWLVKGYLYNPQTLTAFKGLIIISTCKCYIMEIIADENDDDVNKWLKLIVACTIDRLIRIQLLPWKLGFAIKLKDWGNILLLLQDILRTDNLMLHFVNNNLPSQCELIHQPSDNVIKCLTSILMNQKLQIFSLLNFCDITCETAKRSLTLCGLIITNSHIYLTNNKLSWLNIHDDNDVDDPENDVEVCVTQLMTNLVEVERLTDTNILICFLDENVNKEEQWRCSFETQDNTDSCLNAIAQSWEKLFGVPLMNS